MALDVALMARARRTGEAVFRIYTWAAPTLSFGRNQTAQGRYHLDRIAALGFDVVRRPTGGRAILHHHEITYSVTAPASDAVGLKPAYRRINALLELGLSNLGISVAPADGRQPSKKATLDSHSVALRPTDVPCFAMPSEGEMVTNGRKLVGSAQWRDDGALLQHGSILVDDDQQLLPSVMVDPPTDLPHPATLQSILGRIPSVDEVAKAMHAALLTLEDARAELLEPALAMREDPVPTEFFLKNEWTWRR